MESSESSNYFWVCRVELHGSSALLTAPLHWIISLVGGYGFWFQRRWILPAAAAYAF